MIKEACLPPNRSNNLPLFKRMSH